MKILNGKREFVKIEYTTKYMFLFKMSINPYLLKKGNEYIIRDNEKRIYRGTFIRMTCFTILMKPIDNGEQIFKHYDEFYDLEEIRENGKRARQLMEQRALNTILKRIVNENFEW
jgi:hypothetical protein